MRALKRLWLGMLRSIAATLLKWIPNNQPHGTRLFAALCRHIWYIAFEATLLRRRSNGQIEVFLTKREPHDTYPGQWHIPGSIFRSMDNGPEDVAKRLAEREYCRPITSFELVDRRFNPNEWRGKCLHLMYLITVQGDPPGGKWYPVDHLPEDLVLFHRHIMPAMVEAFEKKSS